MHLCVRHYGVVGVGVVSGMRKGLLDSVCQVVCVEVGSGVGVVRFALAVANHLIPMVLFAILVRQGTAGLICVGVRVIRFALAVSSNSESSSPLLRPGRGALLLGLDRGNFRGGGAVSSAVGGGVGVSVN